MKYSKQIKFILPVIAVFGIFAFLFSPRYEQEKQANRQIAALLEQPYGFRYEAEYTYQDSDGRTKTITVAIPPQNPSMRTDLYDSIEDQLIEDIKKAAYKLNIELPEDFESNIRIASYLE